MVSLRIDRSLSPRGGLLAGFAAELMSRDAPSTTGQIHPQKEKIGKRLYTMRRMGICAWRRDRLRPHAMVMEVR